MLHLPLFYADLQSAGYDLNGKQGDGMDQVQLSRSVGCFW
jgi:hypothetical protein